MVDEREAERAEMQRLIRDVFWTEKGLFVMSGVWRTTHLLLGLTATAASITAGATIITRAHPVVAGVCAFIAALASGLLTFLKPLDLADRHSRSARQLAALRVEMRQTLFLEVSNLAREAVRDRIGQFAARKEKIDAEAPHIPNMAIRVVEHRKKLNKYGSEPEVA